MNDYKKYKYARDKAWQLLLGCQIDKLPIQITDIYRKLGISLHSYNVSANFIAQHRLHDFVRQTDGFCINTRGQYHVFYDSDLPVTRKRFTLGHELGHIMLGHVQNGQCSARNREPTADDAPEETQANQFAARILAPACVLHELHVLQPDQIAALCGISLTAATFRSERMLVLEQRGKFYLSPLERAVRDQFQQFIYQNSSSV